MRIKNKMDSQLIFIILSVLITGVLAINAHLSDNKKEKELKEKTEEIVGLQKDLIKSGEETKQKQEELIIEQKRISEFQEKLDSNSADIAKITKKVANISKRTEELVSYIKKDIDNAMIRDFSLQIQIWHLDARDMERIHEKNIIEPFFIEFWQKNSEKNKIFIGFGECNDEFNDIRGNKLILTYDETLIINSRISFDIPGSSVNSNSELDKKKILYFKISNLSGIPIKLGSSYTRVLLKLKRNQQPFEAKSLKVEKNNFVGYFENINY